MQGDTAVPSTSARGPLLGRERGRDGGSRKFAISISQKMKESEREGGGGEGERGGGNSNHTVLIEIHLRPFVFAPPFLSISSSFMCLRAHGCARYSRHDAP